VYVPSFSGVFYEVLDVPLEQISRIEVIRGPGGSVWGTNAVNGVINILAKKPPLPQVLPSSQVAPPLSMAPHCFSKAAASLSPTQRWSAAMGLQSPDDLIGKTDLDFFPREFAADSSNSTPAITLVTSTRSRTHPRQRLIPAQPLESSAATPAS
jgi:hypothetical protein